MDPGPLETPDQLFERALALAIEEREPFLEDVCSDAPELKAELISLLAAVDDADSFFESLARSVISQSPWADGAQTEPGGGPDALVGESIRQYHIEEKLGVGGMGVVYRAYDTRLDRTVALKFLPPHLSANEAAKERFLVEARAAAALDHPNVCAIHEVGEDEGGRLFIAMAYYEGETLAQKLERGPIPAAEAADYAQQSAAGLAAAHAAGLVHRDIKPANLIVAEDGTLKILDFGLAKTAEASLTEAGTRLGTPAYMSPEQTRGGEVDASTDLWSLGVVLYELLTGQRPFRGERNSAVIHAIRHEEPRSPRELRPVLPPDVERLVLGLLHKDPEKRRLSAEQVSADLADPAMLLTGRKKLVYRARRQTVWLTIASYAIFFWIVLQIAEPLSSLLGLPLWFGRATLVVLVLGLPILLLTATAERARGSVTGRASERRAVRGVFTWRNALLGGVAAFALLGVVTAGWMITRTLGVGPPPEAIADEAGEGIAVVPFTVRGSDMEVWREGMVDLFSTSLDGVGGYRTIDSRTVMARWSEVVGGGDAAPDLETTLEVAGRSGARYVLTGSAVAIGADVRLAADIYDVASGDEIAEGQVEGSPDDVLDLVDRLSVEVMGALFRDGDSQLLSRHQSASVTTSSLPALKAYLEGEALYRRADFSGATEAFERAVAEDSLFALAHYRLSYSYVSIGDGISERALENIETATRLSDRLRPRDQLLLSGTRALLNRDLAGVEFHRDAVRKYPDDPEAWYGLGEWYWHYGGELMVDLSEAERALSHAMALDPTFAPYYLHLIHAAIIKRDSTRAAELLETYVALAPDSEGGQALSIAVPLFLGDSAGHRKALDEVREVEVGVLRSIYINLYYAGQPSAMEAVARELQAREGGRRGGIAAALTGQGKVQELKAWVEDASPGGRAYHLWVIHRFIQPLPPEELEGLDVSACGEGTDLNAQCSRVLGSFAADRGDWVGHSAMVKGHRELANGLRAEGDSTMAEVVDRSTTWLEAYGTWRHGSRDEAIQTLQAHQGRNRIGDRWYRWLLAELYVEAGRPDRAVPYFESKLGWPLHSYSRYRLCGLYEEVGETEKARAACEAFLRAWQHADPDLPQLEEARETLARLWGEA